MLGLIVVFYICMIQNNTLYKGISILNHEASVYFEILELSILVVISFLLYKQKQYIILLVFVIELLEHINQIIFCYRQQINSLHIITIILDIMFVFYSYLKKCYWVIPFFIIGILIHLISIYYNKPFTDIVCII